MQKVKFVFLLAVVGFASACYASPSTTARTQYAARNESNLIGTDDSDRDEVNARRTQAQISQQSSVRGWDYLYLALKKEGVPESDLKDAFTSKRLPLYTEVPFRARPRESHHSYRGHLRKDRRNNALVFYRANERAFAKASRRYGIEPLVMLAVLQVETFCGTNMGGSQVFYRLARMASAGDEVNINISLKEAGQRLETTTADDLRERAEYLEETFRPHVIASFKLARKLDITVHELIGSTGGALGMPQFLPGNVFLRGVDGDGDGRINVFEAVDSIYSVGKFLSEEKAASEKKTLRAAIYGYNRSDAYVDTVLALAAQLKRDLGSPVKKVAKTVTGNRLKQSKGIEVESSKKSTAPAEKSNKRSADRPRRDTRYE